MSTMALFRSIMAQFEIPTYLRHLYTATLTYTRATRSNFINNLTSIEIPTYLRHLYTATLTYTRATRSNFINNLTSIKHSDTTCEQGNLKSVNSVH